MVAGHLREKKGYYYAVLNYTDSLGKRKTKWISTGLTVKGNKKRAEAILMDARRNFNPEEPKVMNGDILFADYMEHYQKLGCSPDICFLLDYGQKGRRTVFP